MGTLQIGLLQMYSLVVRELLSTTKIVYQQFQHTPTQKVFLDESTIKIGGQTINNRFN